MKILVASETVAEGGKHVTLPLPQPAANLDFYRDVAVVAFPLENRIPEPEMTLLTQKKTDSVKAFPIMIPVQESDTSDAVLECRFPETVDARYVELKFTHSVLFVSGTVEVPAEDTKDGAFRTVGMFRYGTHVDTKGGKLVSLTEKDGKPQHTRVIRIRFKYTPLPSYIGSAKTELASVRFFSNSMIPQVETANSSMTSFGYRVPKTPEEKGIAPDPHAGGEYLCRHRKIRGLASNDENRGAFEGAVGARGY